MKNKVPISQDRYNRIVELEEFTNAVLCIAATSKELIEELFAKHKNLNVKMDVMEKLAWSKIRDGAAALDHIAFQTDKDNYNRFKKSVCMVKFLMLELIAHCDDNNMRVWQFHNLLKSFKLVFPSLAQTIENEQKAFEELFGKNEESSN